MRMLTMMLMMDDDAADDDDDDGDDELMMFMTMLSMMMNTVSGASCPVVGSVRAVLAVFRGSPEPSRARLGAVLGWSGGKSEGGKKQ